MRTFPALRASLMFTLLVAGCATTPESSSVRGAPQGLLGHRIGTYLHLEGMRSDQGKSGHSTLLVDHVNGERLDPPTSIWLDNLELPEGERCRVSGFETGRWIGIPPDVARMEAMNPRQAGWQFAISFVVTSIQAPESLRKSATNLER